MLLHTIAPACPSIRSSTIATEAADEDAAAAAIAASGNLSDGGLCILFATTDYDLGRLGKALSRLGIHQVIGAKTGCAIGAHGFQKHGITGFYLPPQRFTVAEALLEDVARFGLPDARELARSLREKHRRPGADASRPMFGIVIADAGARCEERLVAALGMEFAGIPLIGGSAGDVYFNPARDPPDARRLLYKGAAVQNAALFCLISSQTPVHALSHNHYVAGKSKIVITDADPERRLVREINGRPALAEYAKACGLRKPAKDVAEYAPYPLMIRIGGQYFARGVQRVHPDGSIEFACAIESGVVAAIAEPQDMLARLEAMFADLESTVGPPELIIGFECAARTVFMILDMLSRRRFHRFCSAPGRRIRRARRTVQHRARQQFVHRAGDRRARLNHGGQAKIGQNGTNRRGNSGQRGASGDGKTTGGAARRGAVDSRHAADGRAQSGWRASPTKTRRCARPCAR